MIRLEPLAVERGWTIIQDGAVMGTIKPDAWNPKVRTTAALRELCDRIDEAEAARKAGKGRKR